MNRSRNRSAIFPRTASVVCLVTLLALALALVPAATAQMSGRVVHRNLAELVQGSDVILRGDVIEARLEPHPDYPDATTMLITLRVQEVLKGKAGETYTFRQYVFDPRDGQQRLGYKKGESVVLILYPPSRMGLSSPVGLEQGRFRLWIDSKGTVMVANGMQNAGLFRNVANAAPTLELKVAPAARQLLRQHVSGPIPYDQFQDIVRNLVAQ
jgi:hypothetical protein